MLYSKVMLNILMPRLNNKVNIKTASKIVIKLASNDATKLFSSLESRSDYKRMTTTLIDEKKSINLELK